MVVSMLLLALTFSYVWPLNIEPWPVVLIYAGVVDDGCNGFFQIHPVYYPLLPRVSCAQPPGRHKSVPTKCMHTTVQYFCFSATCSVALPCHVGICDSSKSAITISPVEIILIPRHRLD